MKTRTTIGLVSILCLSLCFNISFQKSATAQEKDNWTEAQLMQPAALAKIIKDNPTSIYIYDIGPSGVIKGAIPIGEGSEPQNIQKMRGIIRRLPKNTPIVVYCGCCPFKNCPNIRPALSLLSELSFTNYKLLNLPNNLKKDWIDKGYPMSSK